MGEHRRNFLKIAGLGILGVSAKPAVDALAATQAQQYSPNQRAFEGKRWVSQKNTRGSIGKTDPKRQR